MTTTLATPVAVDVRISDVHQVLYEGAHRALRREFGRMPALFISTPGADIAVRLRVRSHAREFVAALRTSLTLGHDLVARQSRTGLVDHGSIDHLAAQRADLERQLVRIEQHLSRFPVLDGPELARSFSRLATELDSYLVAECSVVEPAVRGEAWPSLAARARMSVVPRRRLAMLGHLLEGAAAADRERVIDELSTPVRSVWRFAGERRFRDELAVLDAIAAGRFRSSTARATPATEDLA